MNIRFHKWPGIVCVEGEEQLYTWLNNSFSFWKMHLPEPGEPVRRLGRPAHQHRQTGPAVLESVGVAARLHLYSNSRSNEGEITDILLHQQVSRWLIVFTLMIFTSLATLEGGWFTRSAVTYNLLLLWAVVEPANGEKENNKWCLLGLLTELSW